jgi:cystathionine beta-lyase family protein involved in aluminum resistance
MGGSHGYGWDDTFTDALDDSVSAEVIDNADGAHIVVNLFHDDGTALGIALNYDQAMRMAEVLRTLAAGL